MRGINGLLRLRDDAVPERFHVFARGDCLPERSVAAATDDSVRAHLVADVPEAVFLG